jgi:hypothetical protein
MPSKASWMILSTANSVSLAERRAPFPWPAWRGHLPAAQRPGVTGFVARLVRVVFDFRFLHLPQQLAQLVGLGLESLVPRRRGRLLGVQPGYLGVAAPATTAPDGQPASVHATTRAQGLLADEANGGIIGTSVLGAQPPKVQV